MKKLNYFLSFLIILTSGSLHAQQISSNMFSQAEIRIISQLKRANQISLMVHQEVLSGSETSNCKVELETSELYTSIKVKVHGQESNIDLDIPVYQQLSYSTYPGVMVQDELSHLYEFLMLQTMDAEQNKFLYMIRYQLKSDGSMDHFVIKRWSIKQEPEVDLEVICSNSEEQIKNFNFIFPK